MKKTLIFAFALAVALSAIDMAEAAAPRVIKAAHTGNVKQKYQAASELFKELVEKRSEGRFQVDIFPGTLGGDRELIEALQIGTADFSEVNTSVLATIAPRLGVLDLPYIFTSREHAYSVLDGPVGTELMKEAEAKSSLVCLTYWENGFRCFTNSVRPIKTPGDLHDLKMRSMQNAIHLETFRLWGANPTPMSFPEMITGMQQGVIDGHDNAPDTVAANSMWEIQSHFSESMHFYAAKIYAASPIFWSTLSADDQKMFREICDEVRDYERKLAIEQFDSSIDDLRKNGMNVVPNEEMDTAAFQESVKPIWDEYASTLGEDLIKKVSGR